jgi:hypothetical protein
VLREIAGSMVRVAASKGGHFGLMAAILVLACVALLRPRLLDADARRLCIVAAVAFVGYTAFLLVAYVGGFTEYEAVRAASFWRYSTHLGLLGVVTAVAVVLPYWRWRPRVERVLGVVGCIILLAVPAATAKRLRFDLDHPHDGYVMAVAREMRPLLPAGVRILLVDADGNGSDLLLARYELLYGERDRKARRKYGLVTLHSGAVPDVPTGAYVWLENGGPEMRGLFGLDLPSGASYLMLRTSEGFRLVQTWPITAETDVFRPEDLE